VNVLYAFSETLGEGVSLVCLAMIARLSCVSHTYFPGLFTGESDLFWSRCSPLGVYPSEYLYATQINIHDHQAAKDIRASQDTLADIFERIENFFRRLQNYTEIPPTPDMMDIIGKILVEVLSILTIATKEIKQGRTSESSGYTMSQLTEPSAEKYMKRLIGRTDVEDGLKRLDKLTDEEARMATAQALRVTHTVAEDVYQVKRSSFANLVSSDCGVLTRPWQETNCGIAFTNGSPHQTRPRTITLRVALIKSERQTGSFKGASSPGGNQQIRYFGFTESVCPMSLAFFPHDPL